MTKPNFTPQISLGNVLQFAALIAGLALGWAKLETTTELTAATAEANKAELSELDIRLRTVENDQARADERFSSILSMLARIDGRLERIEEDKRP